MNFTDFKSMIVGISGVQTKLNMMSISGILVL